MLALFLALHVADSGPWTWAPGPEAALALAGERDVPLVVALHHEGELRSEELLASVYAAEAVAELAADTVNLVGSATTHSPDGEPCPRFEGIECRDHRDALEWAVATYDLGREPRLPQHLWLRPGGQVLHAVPFELDAGELAWCFARARFLVGGGEPLRPEGARPPRRLVVAQPYRPDPSLPFDRGLTAAELEDRLKLVRSSARAGAGRHEAGAELLFAHHADAAKAVGQELGRGGITWNGSQSLETLLQVIGRLSSPVFADLLADHTRDRSPQVRHRAAVALEQMGPASAAKAVRSALAKEKEPHLVRCWIRALGATGYDDRSSSKALRKAATSEPDDLLRRNALFALGYLPAEGRVFEALVEALGAELPGDRQAAAYGMALARDDRYVEPLRAAARAERDALDEGTRAAFARALAVLRGAPLHTLEAEVRALLQDELPRERVFFR